jgi:hypothetical protein
MVEDYPEIKKDFFVSKAESHADLFYSQVIEFYKEVLVCLLSSPSLLPSSSLRGLFLRSSSSSSSYLPYPPPLLLLVLLVLLVLLLVLLFFVLLLLRPLVLLPTYSSLPFLFSLPPSSRHLTPTRKSGTQEYFSR